MTSPSFPGLTGSVGDVSISPADPSVPSLDPSTAEWQRVSPKYIVVDLVSNAVGMLIAFATTLVAAIVFGPDQPWLWLLPAAFLVLTIVVSVLTPRRVRSIGYLLRDDDLLFRRGILFQRLVAVPYGRMQLVDITRGPIARAVGLAELKLVTAAAATGVLIPGLPLEEAERLRDHLVAVAESRRAGL